MTSDIINYLSSTNEQIFIDNVERDAYNRIDKNLDDCSEFLFNVAFIKFSGLQWFLKKFKDLENKNIKGKILTTNYMNATELGAIEKLLEFKNIEVKIYDYHNNNIGLHAKTYIFKKENTSKVIIGSSNITSSGLRINHEWNLELEYDNESETFEEIKNNFYQLWNLSNDFNKNLFKTNKEISNLHSRTFDAIKQNIAINKMQERVLNNIKFFRNQGKTRALVIAATGTGKTYLSAFDVKTFQPNKMLFVVHRKEILDSAKNTFRNVFSNIQICNLKELKKQNKVFVFDTIQTLSYKEKYKNIDPNFFDYIILDEAHHAGAKTYQMIFDYFKPKFLLGLTATPERYDGENIYEKFNNNVALDLRLEEALNEELLCPFNYFGVNELKDMDLSKVDVTKASNYEKILMVKKRVDYIVEKLRFYSDPTKELKCLGFCASIEHAKYMANEFNKLGIKSAALIGDNDVNERLNKINDLKKGKIEVIFSVDIFNEGVDIPEINTILMLRPTQSPTIFIQQLGRGLRKSLNKDSVTIIDFIGNHKNLYNLALSFGGDYLYDKEALKEYVQSDFSGYSKYSFFQLDRIAKKTILDKIDQINFENLDWLKERYKDFKNLFSNKKHIPMWMDYLNKEKAPNIIKFIKNKNNKFKTYFNFLELIKEETEQTINENENKILSTLESFLPLTRNYEYIILKKILENSHFDINNFDKKEFINFNEIAFKSAIKDLKLECYLSAEIKKFQKIIRIIDNKIYFSKELNQLLKKDFFKLYISELLEYGLANYYSNCKDENINKLNHYQEYSRHNILKLLNWEKRYSTSVGGVSAKINNNYAFFVNLDKSQVKSEKLKYKDGFINKKIFRWDSPNATYQNSILGKDLINHKKLNIKLHLFVRKDKKEKDKSTKPFIYLGLVNVKSYEGNKPIHFELELEQPVDNKIYNYLVD